jgi:hypothetical protein
MSTDAFFHFELAFDLDGMLGARLGGCVEEVEDADMLPAYPSRCASGR